MNETILYSSALVVGLSSAILVWQIMVQTDRTTKVLCTDVLSIQCLALAILLGFSGLGYVALQFGFALALLGFISTVVLSHLIKP